MSTDASLTQKERVTDYVTGGATGFFTMSSGARVYEIEMWGGGTGGGSGRKGAAGTARTGGGGGGGSGLTRWTISAAELLALYPTGQVPYQVGLGTAGGAAVSANDTNGNLGASPTDLTGSFFGPLFSRGGVFGGGAGLAAVSGAAGLGGYGTGTGANGGISSATGGVGGSAIVGTNGGAGGGGSGGGITAADVASNGGVNSTSNLTAPRSMGSDVSGGVVGGAAPTAGAAPTFFGPGPGAGGGAASITGNAQNGADAHHFGGGGGGGGAALNGVGNSGAGGRGGDGRIRVVESF